MVGLAPVVLQKNDITGRNSKKKQNSAADPAFG
jgi:hypothetical protein